MMSDKNSQADQKQSSHSKEETYEKRGNAGKKGTDFQIDSLITVLLNSSINYENWHISTENTAAGIFDDVVIELLPPLASVLIQTKHKETKKINYTDLISVSPQNEFSLPKYFLSYQEIKDTFAIQNVIICTNTNIGKKVKTVVEKQHLSTESPLYLKGQNIIYYTFKESFLSEFKQSLEAYCTKNLGDKEINPSDDSIKCFLRHLQLVVNYPTGSTLSKAFKNMIPQIGFAQGLDRKTCVQHIKSKINDWYIQRKATYLTQVKSRAFFCEIRSNMYCDTLKTYDISFKSSELPWKEPNKRMLLIYPEQEYILSVIKVYQALQNEGMSKVLFLSLGEKIDVQKQHFIDAFEVPYYIYLIIICPKIVDNLSQEMREKLAHILSSTNYKKVILIAEEGNKLIEKIKDVNISFSEMKEKIGFSSLANDAQENYKKMKCITFQGNDISLDELLPTLSNEKLNDVINPETLVKFATKKKIEVGLKVNHLGENIKCYYIQRQFKRDNANIAEVDLYQYCEEKKENIVLISDAPGMGKSTVLKNLAASLKKNNPNLWIIRFDINNYTDALLSVQEANLQSITIEKLLNSEDRTRLSSELEEKVFLLPRKVVLMINGIDEISPTYEDIVLNLLKECKGKPNFAIIVITTRPHLREALELKLQVKSWTMKSFSKIDQIVFLKEYWLKNLNLTEDLMEKCQVYAEALIEKMFQWFKYTFAGIPLQARMLAEVFQEEGNNLEECETCKEFLTSTGRKPNLPNKFDLVKLYDMFIGKKYDEFINYFGGKLSNYRKIYKDCKRYHHILALKTILSEENCELFDCYKMEGRKNIDEEYPLKFGIIQKVDGKIHFIHRTFAEYFVAKCLIEQLKRGSNSEQFYIFLMNNVLMSDPFNINRSFLNSFLQTEADLLPCNTYKDIAKQLHQVKQVVLITAKEGTLGILGLLFECFDAANIDMDITNVKIDGRTAVGEATKGNHLDMICFLIKKGAKINHRDENGRTALYLAVINGNLDIVKCLVKNGIDINSRDNDGRTASDVARRMNALSIVDYLAENGADEKQLSHSKEETYKKFASAGKNVLDFHMNLLITVLINNSIKNENWRLSTENRAAGIFDDIVIEFLPSLASVLIQTKHKKTKKINYTDLISDSHRNDFSLPKYFLSYQQIKETFEIDNVIICTNTNIAENVNKVVKEKCLSTKSPLHLEGQNVTYYTFTESFLSEFKQSLERYYTKNLGDKEIRPSNDSIKCFLWQLQLVVNYPTGSTLSKAFENMIPKIEFAQGLDSKTCVEYINRKIDAWYTQPKGTYLTQVESKAFFCEIRSNMYCDTLKPYDISFKSSELPLKEPNKRLLLIYPEQEYIMSVVKVHQSIIKALQNEDMSKVLFLSLDEKIDVQKQFIDAFEVPHYIYLIIICPKIVDNLSQEMREKLARILNSTDYKKVILIAEEGNKLVEKLKM